ncbi:MAG: cytochrome c oxidase subunit 3 [Fimbriimonadales bacterium]|nr:cytochrome c oxidase subunit 3 [Fimbriimonadales bacterium]
MTSEPQGKSESKGNGTTPYSVESETVRTARFGMALVVLAFGVMFAALAILYIARRVKDAPNYWFQPPVILWASTATILLSSVTCQVGAFALNQNDRQGLSRWLGITFLLGWLFVVFQIIAWTQMAPQFAQARKPGQPNPFVDLFYVMTVIHAVHVAGGLGWLGYVWQGARKGLYSASKRVPVDLSIAYWHLMDGVWLVFFCLLWFL